MVITTVVPAPTATTVTRTAVGRSDGKKLVVTAKATLIVHDKHFDRDEILTRTMGDHEMLIGLRLGGQKEELTFSDQVADIDKN